MLVIKEGLSRRENGQAWLDPEFEVGSAITVADHDSTCDEEVRKGRTPIDRHPIHVKTDRYSRVFLR